MSANDPASVTNTGRRGAPKRRKARPSDGDDVRVEILKSAAKAFRLLGYHGATVEKIAASLRMQKGNLYYYFRSKEEILFACHQYSLDRLLALLDDVERSSDPPNQKLRGLIVAFVHTSLDELDGTALGLGLEALSPAHLRAVIARRDQFDRGLRRIIDDGIRAGQFTPANVKFLSFAILGAINWIPRWYRPEGPSNSTEIANEFADYLLAGLGSL